MSQYIHTHLIMRETEKERGGEEDRVDNPLLPAWWALKPNTLALCRLHEGIESLISNKIGASRIHPF